MLDFIYNVFINIIMIPITFVIGFFISVLYKKKYQSGIRGALKFDLDKKLTINCFTANTGRYDSEEFVMLGYVFEYMAIGEIRSSFSSIYKSIEMSVKMSESDYNNIRKRHLNGNMILIGGPFHNQITKKLIFNGENEFPFCFDNDANLIYKGFDGKTKMYKPQISQGESKYFEKDYALIINMRNPFDTSKRILALIGCRSVGCYGAAVFISRKLNTIKKKIVDDEYAFVISCEGEEEDIISEPKFVDYYKLDLSAKEMG